MAAILRPDFGRPATPLALGSLPSPLERPTEAARRKAGALIAASTLTDAQIADLAGVRSRQVARWRAGQSTPGAEQLLVLECLAPDTAATLIGSFVLRIALDEQVREETAR